MNCTLRCLVQLNIIFLNRKNRVKKKSKTVDYKIAITFIFSIFVEFF